MSPEAALISVAAIGAVPATMSAWNGRRSRRTLAEHGETLAEVKRLTGENGHRDPDNPTLRDELADVKVDMAHMKATLDLLPEVIGVQVKQAMAEHVISWHAGRKF